MSSISNGKTALEAILVVRYLGKARSAIKYRRNELEVQSRTIVNIQVSYSTTFHFKRISHVNYIFSHWIFAL